MKVTKLCDKVGSPIDRGSNDIRVLVELAPPGL